MYRKWPVEQQPSVTRRYKQLVFAKKGRLQWTKYGSPEVPGQLANFDKNLDFGCLTKPDVMPPY